MRPASALRSGLVSTTLVALTAAAAIAGGIEKRPLAIDDLYRFDGPTQTAVAPDGRSAVYVRQWIDPKTKRERHSLWRVEGEDRKARPLEPGEPDARQQLLIEQLQSGVASRSLLVGIEGGADARQRADLSRALAKDLRASGLFEQVQNGESADWATAGGW